MIDATIIHEGGLREAFSWFGASRCAPNDLAFLSDDEAIRELARDYCRFLHIGPLSDPIIGKACRAPSDEELTKWREYESVLKRYEARVFFPGLPHEEMQVPMEIWNITKQYEHVILNELGHKLLWAKPHCMPGIPTYNKKLFQKALSKLPSDHLLISVDFPEIMPQSGKDYTRQEILYNFFKTYAEEKGEDLVFANYDPETCEISYYKGSDTDARILDEKISLKEFIVLLQQGTFPLLLSYADHWAAHAAWGVGEKTCVPCCLARNAEFLTFPMLTGIRLLTWDNSVPEEGIIRHLQSMGSFVGVETVYKTPSNWRLHRVERSD